MGCDTSCLYHRPPSSPSSDQHRRDQTWQSSEGDVLRLEHCRRRVQRGHGRWIYGNESLAPAVSILSLKLWRQPMMRLLEM